CSPLTECAQGSYQVREPSSTVDRGCMPCASGTFSTMINAESCTPWNACAQVQYQSAPGPALVDRQCKQLTDCVAGERVTTPATSTSDRVCAACTSGYTDTLNATACQVWTNCPDGDYVTQAPTDKQDRECPS